MTNLEFAICEAEQNGEIDLATRNMMLGLISESLENNNSKNLYIKEGVLSLVVFGPVVLAAVTSIIASKIGKHIEEKHLKVLKKLLPLYIEDTTKYKIKDFKYKKMPLVDIVNFIKTDTKKNLPLFSYDLEDGNKSQWREEFVNILQKIKKDNNTEYLSITKGKDLVAIEEYSKDMGSRELIYKNTKYDKKLIDCIFTYYTGIMTNGAREAFIYIKNNYSREIKNIKESTDEYQLLKEMIYESELNGEITVEERVGLLERLEEKYK